MSFSVFRVILIKLSLILNFFCLFALGDKINWESTYVTKFQTEINGPLSLFVTDCSHDNKIIYDNSNNDNNNNYYSFKIFPSFWLAKSTCIIHHNQLQMTKFRRILRLTNQWHQKCSFLQVNAPLTEKTWGRGWVVLVVKTKMADISLIPRVRTMRNKS